MIRQFEEAELRDVVGVWLSSGRDEYSYLPNFQKLDMQKATEVFQHHIQSQCDLWVYVSEEQICGFLAINGSLIDRLYVDPRHQRNGIGTELIRLAQRLSPSGLSLHTHQENTRARKFYEKLGFTAVRFGISPEPECVPDVEYCWTGESASVNC
jgi:ribosomal protein S18 acetylase RimI-like enzyme